MWTNWGKIWEKLHQIWTKALRFVQNCLDLGEIETNFGQNCFDLGKLVRFRQGRRQRKIMCVCGGGGGRGDKTKKIETYNYNFRSL